MSLITIDVLTCEKVNPNANEDKFYRVYSLPPFAGSPGDVLMQNGSQRTGRTGGQFRLPSKSGSSADAEFRRKLNDGYHETARYHFQVDLDRVKQAKDFKALGKLLDNIRASTPQGQDDNPDFSWSGASVAAPRHDGGLLGSPTIHSAPAQVGDAISDITSRVQAAITLAVENPAAAMVEMAELRDLIDVTAERTLKMRSFFETLELLVADAVMGR